MKHLTTYLTFNGNCRDAMTFYQQCTGAELQITAFPDAQGQPSTDPNAGIMHARLVRDGAPILMASDTQPGDAYQAGNNFSVAVECDSLDEIERFFNAFSQGGQVRLALCDVPWGARFGMLTDKFGVQWMFNYELPQPKS